MIQFLDAATMPRQPLRMILYGETRAGKTFASASAPRPLFLSAGLEGGDKTLRSFSGVKVCPIFSSAEMLEAIDRIAKEPSSCDTVVVDSITFYADMYIAELVQKNRGPMRLQDWGLLENHIGKMLLPRLHKLPQHVIWIALEQTEKDESNGAVGRVGPMIQGKLARKLPAVTDMIARQARMPLKCQDGVVREMPVWQVAPQMTPQGPILAGGRFGNVFPEGWIMPTWAALIERIGSYIDTRQTAGTAQHTQAPPANGGA